MYILIKVWFTNVLLYATQPYVIVQSPPSSWFKHGERGTKRPLSFPPPAVPLLCRIVVTFRGLKLVQNHNNLCNLKLFHREKMLYATENTQIQDSIYNVMLGFIQTTNKSRQLKQNHILNLTTDLSGIKLRSRLFGQWRNVCWVLIKTFECCYALHLEFWCGNRSGARTSWSG
jgi:hypothetical protein